MTELNAWKNNTFIKGIECPVCGFSMYDTEIHTMDDWHFCPKCGTRLYAKLTTDLEEPIYGEMPIDLDDDNHCDECYKPVFNECLTDKYNDDCPYGLGECCEDNLATNVGRICFEHNVPTNFAMAIIEIIQKERDRNEYLHLYRKHFPAE